VNSGHFLDAVPVDTCRCGWILDPGPSTGEYIVVHVLAGGPAAARGHGHRAGASVGLTLGLPLDGAKAAEHPALGSREATPTAPRDCRSALVACFANGAAGPAFP
jgi:hypothetical protein